MPELPEVETIARTIEPDVVGRTILSADVRWARTIATPSAAKFKEWVSGQKVIGVSRRAKYLILRLEDYNLLIHLRMSGDLMVRMGTIKPEKHDRLLLHLRAENGTKTYLAFNDTRKFGRVWLTDQPEKVLGKLGPEPLGTEFTPQWLYENLRARSRQLKPLLLDQTFLAGVGNIYADESLHMAKLHPLGSSSSVSKKKAGVRRSRRQEHGLERLVQVAVHLRHLELVLEVAGGPQALDDRDRTAGPRPLGEEASELGDLQAIVGGEARADHRGALFHREERLLADVDRDRHEYPIEQRQRARDDGDVAEGQWVEGARTDRESGHRRPLAR